MSKFVVCSNVNVVGSAISPLLNRPPGGRFIGRVRSRVLSCPGVINIRSLVVRSCNPNERFTSTRTRIPSDISIVGDRSAVSLVRQGVREGCGLLVSVRLSPVIMGSTRVGHLHSLARSTIGRVSPTLSVRSFEIIRNPARSGLVFSMVTPPSFDLSSHRLAGSVRRGLDGVSRECFYIVAISRSFGWSFVFYLFSLRGSAGCDGVLLSGMVQVGSSGVCPRGLYFARRGCT